MKKIIILLLSILLFSSCQTTKKVKNTKQDNPVKIANKELEYEIIIFDNGFETYLYSIAKPMNYYSESYLENKNKFYVATWNERARNPMSYNPNIYENVIDYDFNTHYGLEVNYKLYNYFKFVEYKYGEHF
jgi:hypothetical protein